MNRRNWRKQACFLLVLCAATAIALPAQDRSMQLLTPDVGWALTGGQLFWTTDGGDAWRDITPAPASRSHLLPGQLPARAISSVFFLDTSTGWLLLAGGDEKTDELWLDLAATADAGATWSTTRVTLPHTEPGTLNGYGRIDFVDGLHGWMDLDMVSSSAFRPALFLETKDGGKTWDRPPASPQVGGDIRFVTLQDGWLAGGPANGDLYVTHDGSKT